MSDSGEGTSTSDDPESTIPGPRPIRISLALAVASAALVLVISSVRLLRDGSFWLDEASIAINLIQQRPLELLGPYLTGHSFPRLYLIPIAGLMEAFGYHTLVLRLLPFLAFVAGAIAWHRLAYLRLRREPVLLALIIALNLIPGAWLAYSVMLKQYSLDVLLALVPFLLSDAFFDRRLGEGSNKAALLALPWLSLLSFTFAIPLLARVLGWYAWGVARGRRKLDAGAAGGLAASFALAIAALWLVDMRHTATNPQLFHFWARCIPGESWPQAPQMFVDYFAGWYRVMPFGVQQGLAEPMIAVIGMATLMGGALILRRTARPDATSDPDVTHWGSRSLGCLICIGGLLAASMLVSYPICSGRLTLFSLFSLQIVTIEGFGAISSWLPGRRPWPLGARAIWLVLLLILLPTSFSSARFMLLHDTPENVRPLIPMIDDEPPLPILVAACSTRQLTALPEWMGREDVMYYDERVGLGQPGLPEAREFWVISAGSAFYCPWFRRSLEREAEEVRYYNTAKNTAALMKVHMPERGEQ